MPSTCGISQSIRCRGRLQKSKRLVAIGRLDDVVTFGGKKRPQELAIDIVIIGDEDSHTAWWRL
jgi:hypothetical protein